MFRIDDTYNKWTGKRIVRHVFYWLAWLLFYAVVNSAHYEGAMMPWINFELFIMIIKLPFTYFVIYFLVPNYLIKKRYYSFIIYLILIASISGILIQVFMYDIIGPVFFDVLPAKLTPVKIWNPKITYKVLDLIYIASLPIIFKLVQHYIKQESITRQITEQKLSAELEILKNQLHPHFLFNTLNNLYGMVLTKHERAADVVILLSEMMSYMLYECGREKIAIEKEIKNLENYIELEKIRYGKRLDISFEIGGQKDGYVAPLLLIPFLENAFKHGVEKSETKAWVRANLWIENDMLTFMVENSIAISESDIGQLPKTQSGIGLTNVRKRLDLIYPDKHQLEIKQSDTFLIQLNLQLNDEMLNH